MKNVKLLKTCIYCGKVFQKDFSCEHTMKKFKNLEKLKLGYDYVICEWNKHPVVTIKESYLKRNFNKGLDEYKKEFPNVQLYSTKYIETLRKNSTENNGNSKENTTEYQRKSCSPFAIEFYERLYPDLSDDERKQKLIDFKKDKLSDIPNPKTLEYHINKGLNVKDAKLKISESQRTFSLEICIQKHGLEKGTEIFNDRQKRWIETLKKNGKFGIGTGSSKVCEDFIDLIVDKFGIKSDEYKSYKNGKEKFISNGLINCSYDFCLLKDKKIIEFNGDLWHANPIKFKPNDLFNPHDKKLKAKDKWKYDKTKIDLAKSYGYEVLTIWENDWRNSSEIVLEIVKCFLDK